jgi:signal transduction histidine kinase
VRLRRPLAKRVILATILCGVVGFVSSRVAWRAITWAAIVRFHEPLADYMWEAHEKSRCEASPATWSITLAHGAHAFAYDPATLASLNPQAPPLQRDLWAQVERGPARVAIGAHGFTLASGGALVHRTGDSGPCAVVQTVWPVQRLQVDVLAWIPMGILFAAAAGAGLGFFLIVRPLERVERHRQELQRHLGDVAHDLRTPIASLHLALEQAVDGNRDTEVGALLSRALGDTVYLAALTANLRMASEMREGWNPATTGTEADLAEIVERVVDRARFFAKRRGIAVECARPDGPTKVACDPVAAEQAISNVVQNAVTYGESGGHVAVVLERREGRFSLVVSDDGPGVPPSEIPRLGERTFRSDEARQRDPRGSGLGLAITSEVCTRCGWSLAFGREEPRGLRVSITGACR